MRRKRRRRRRQNEKDCKLSQPTTFLYFSKLDRENYRINETYNLGREEIPRQLKNKYLMGGGHVGTPTCKWC
jgi:hypothetical protein